MSPLLLPSTNAEFELYSPFADQDVAAGAEAVNRSSGLFVQSVLLAHEASADTDLSRAFHVQSQH